MIIPHQVPEKGFYYHYKHDPYGAVNNCAYEVLGVGVHSEDDGDPRNANMVVYIPIYDCPLADQMHLFQLRPLTEWMGEVEIKGKNVPRFQKISDPDIIKQLVRQRGLIYGRMSM